MVDGDAIKISRIVQNLVLNAIKYTHQGGVSVTWGDSAGTDIDRWFIQVKDTGPGFHAGPGALLAGALEVATEQAKHLAAEDGAGDVPHAHRPPPGGPAKRFDARAVHQQQGEGIGLSIVKRLCELLDATIEMDSTFGVGTTFRYLAAPTVRELTQATSTLLRCRAGQPRWSALRICTNASICACLTRW